jgi:O-antigen ligase
MAGLIALLLIMRSRRYWLPLMVVAVIGAFVAAEGFGDSIVLQGWEALGERTERAGLAQDRIERFLMGPITGIEEAGVFGYGVGTNHQASPGFVSGPRWKGWIGGDNRVLRVFAELGAVGFVILTLLKASILYLSFQIVREEKSPVELIVGATGFCVLLGYTLLPVVYNVVSSALYWGCAGAVVGVWSVKRLSKDTHHSPVVSR